MITCEKLLAGGENNLWHTHNARIWNILGVTLRMTPPSTTVEYSARNSAP